MSYEQIDDFFQQMKTAIKTTKKNLWEEQKIKEAKEWKNKSLIKKLGITIKKNSGFIALISCINDCIFDMNNSILLISYLTYTSLNTKKKKIKVKYNIWHLVIQWQIC